MKGSRKLTPEETLKALELSTLADEAMREVLAMSEEELDKDLEAGGFDLEAVRAKAAAQRAKLEAIAAGGEAPPRAATSASPSASPALRAIPGLVGGHPQTPGGAPKSTRSPSPKLTRSRATVLAWLTASTAAAATVATMAWQQMAAHNTPPPPPPIPSEVPAPPSPSPVELAARARAAAFAACDVADWDTCSAKLDEARRLDPSGETSDPRVLAARAKISDELNLDNAKRPPNPTPAPPPSHTLAPAPSR